MSLSVPATATADSGGAATVTFTATVSGASTPASDAARFVVDGSWGSPVAFTSGGVATYTTTLSVGTHQIKAGYLRNGGGFPSPWSSTSTIVVSAAAAHPTSTTLAASPSSITAGDSVTLTATVAESDGGTGIPTGAVSFSAGGGSLGSDTLDGSGVATLDVGGFLAGTQSITATYVGDASNLGSTSSAYLLPVAAAATTHPTTTSLTGSSASITAGGSVTFTATVGESDGGGGTPTGTVQFNGNGSGIGSATLNGSGVATLTTSSFGAGTYTVTASYGGDSSNATSSSGAVALTVNAPPSITATTITVGSSASTIAAGGFVRLLAHVVQSGKQIAPPAGPDVIFSANGNRIGRVALDGNGNATLDASGWLAGHYTVTASYVGDAFNAPASASFDFDVLRGLTVVGPIVSTTYGGAIPALTPTYTGFANGDSASSLTTQPTCTTAATTVSPAGTYAVTCSGASSPSYVIGYVPGTLTVKPAPLTGTPADALMTAGQPVPVLTATYTGFVNGQSLATSGVSGSPLCTTTATSASLPGTYPITCAQGTLTAANYSFVFSGTGTLTVSSTTRLTVTGPTLSVHQGDPIPPLMPIYAGFINGDTPSSLATQPTCTTTATSTSPAGSYPVTCSGGVDQSYTFVYVGGMLTITAGCFDATTHPSCESVLASPVPMPGSSVSPGQTMLIFYVDDTEIGTGSNAPTAVLSTGVSLPVTVTPVFIPWPYWYVDDGRWGWAWHQDALTFQLPSRMRPGDYTILVTARDAQGDFDKFNWAVTVPRPGHDGGQGGSGNGNGGGPGNGNGGGPGGHGHGHNHGPQSQDD